MGFPAHHNAAGIDYLLILKKIPPYWAVGGQECPPYNDYICFMLKIGFAKVSGCLKVD
ncbi:MAG: hypothetical protein IKI11_07260 [Neisseriaceae bacterium]|nr:hypothetical protein [Neisseriaceae bacterium]